MKAAGKKSNKKDKKIDYLVIINEIEEDIVLLFQDIDYGDPNEIKTQLIAKLETTIFNTNKVIIIRSGRIRRVLVRFCNS